jgi:hypothetical protein
MKRSIVLFSALAMVFAFASCKLEPGADQKQAWVPMIDFTDFTATKSMAKAIELDSTTDGIAYLYAPILTGFTQTTITLETEYKIHGPNVTLPDAPGIAVASEVANGVVFNMNFGQNGPVEVFTADDGSTFNYAQNLIFTFPADPSCPYSEFQYGANYLKKVVISDSSFSNDSFHVEAVAYQYIHYPNPAGDQYYIARTKLEIFNNSDYFVIMAAGVNVAEVTDATLTGPPDLAVNYGFDLIPDPVEGTYIEYNPIDGGIDGYDDWSVPNPDFPAGTYPLDYVYYCHIYDITNDEFITDDTNFSFYDDTDNNAAKQSVKTFVSTYISDWNFITPLP